MRSARRNGRVTSSFTERFLTNVFSSWNASTSYSTLWTPPGSRHSIARARRRIRGNPRVADVPETEYARAVRDDSDEVTLVGVLEDIVGIVAEADLTRDGYDQLRHHEVGRIGHDDRVTRTEARRADLIAMRSPGSTSRH